MKTPSPRFDLAAARNLLPDADAAMTWIVDTAIGKNAGVSENNTLFAQSLFTQYKARGGLTLRQWQAAAAAIHGKQFNVKPAPADKPAPSAAPITQPVIKLNPAQRAIARRAIASAAGWPAYSKANGINTAALSGSKLFDAANALGVDVSHAIADSNAAAKQRNADVFAAIAGKDDAGDAGATGRVDWSRIRAIVREEIEARVKPVVQTVTVIDRWQQAPRPVAGVQHPEFDKLARAVNCRDFSGNRLSVMLVGPTGTGKSYACKQLADAMGLPFYFQSQADESFALVGYERVNGTMKETQFVQAFQNGGVCLLDELDRYDPKALTALNAALANGRISLDNGTIVQRHPDFICVGAANTSGMGASADFTAAEKLDLSTISRFSVRLDWYMAPEMESSIAAQRADDAGLARHWLDDIRKARAVMKRLGLPYLADQRAIETGANLLAAGMTVADVRAITYLAPLTKDQKQAVLDLL